MSQRAGNILENMLEYYVSKEAGKVEREVLREARIFYTEHDVEYNRISTSDETCDYKSFSFNIIFDINEEVWEDATLNRLT